MFAIPRKILAGILLQTFVSYKILGLGTSLKKGLEKCFLGGCYLMLFMLSF